MNKPISLLIKDSKQSIINTINETNLPPCLLEPIIKEIYFEVQGLVKQELVKDEKDYNESLNNDTNDE